MNQRKLPIGIDDFPFIREQGFYYVDKSMFIDKLLRSYGMVNLFTRPRRFGKSLTMSMLRSFFEIGGDPSLFCGLAIEKDKELCAQYQGQYPVVSITLKGIEGETYENAVESLRMVFSTECKRLRYLEESTLVDDDDRRMFHFFRTREGSETELKYFLAILMRMLHAHHGKRVILLIDEYDVPLDKSSKYGYYDRMVMLMRAIFGEAFKTNPDLFFAVLTGCLRISKESIFTGINNLVVDSIADQRYDEYFGFTDKDVRKILEDYDLCGVYGTMREWYDGYRFGDTDVYCPWDVLNYCRKLLENPDAEPEAFWNNSSENALVKQFIDKADRRTREDIERLIAGEVIERQIAENLTYGEVDESIDNLWSVLFLTGYLTQDKERKSDKFGHMRLVIPNKEVRFIFVDKIQKWFKEKVKQSSDRMNELYHALACGEEERAERIISTQLKNTISYFDEREDFYHGFLLGLLSCNQNWLLRSNRETGLGRCDILIEDDEDRFGIVIEVKRAEREADLEIKCNEALRQIEEKEYAAELLNVVEHVWVYGIAFARKRCCLKAKRVK